MEGSINLSFPSTVHLMLLKLLELILNMTGSNLQWPQQAFCALQSLVVALCLNYRASSCHESLESVERGGVEKVGNLDVTSS